MTISTYTELSTAVENWLGHTQYTARIPEFITLFEAVANRRLRTRQQETYAILTPASSAATLPTDYLSWRSLTWGGDTAIELEYVPPSYMRAAYPVAAAGPPRVFSIEGETITLNTTDTTALLFDYYAKIPALLTTDPNWLMTAHPDLYLFGTLCEAQAFGADDDRFAMWATRRDEIFNEISMLANKSRGQGGMRVMTVTP